MRWWLGDNQSVRSSAPVVSRWFWPGNRTFLELASMVVTRWIVAFLRCVSSGKRLWACQGCYCVPKCRFIWLSQVDINSFYIWEEQMCPGSCCQSGVINSKSLCGLPLLRLTIDLLNVWVSMFSGLLLSAGEHWSICPWCSVLKHLWYVTRPRGYCLMWLSHVRIPLEADDSYCQSSVIISRSLCRLSVLTSCGSLLCLHSGPLYILVLY